ncbi:type I secretion system permease/ATPase [Sphingosinicella humi]|uniref:Type I secretion system permease/ATPase n=1 Tax=Allosphingosinicella humi TaxID=2068657 RepID=A0A2U2J4Z2_9SPHN|nr:type I secretion system permease/ATPase [Sphingosinicella humi]PWG03419.1 type I secretion system permease/ATPase [Sphingosinicella humi]
MNKLNEGALKQAIAATKSHYKYAAAFSALLNILFIFPVLYMLQVYDRVVPTQGTLTLVLLTIVLMFALMTLSLLDYSRSRLLVRASARLDQVLARPILSMALGSSDRSDIGLRQAMREFDTLRQTVSGTSILALLDAPWTPIYILICFLIHPLLGLLAFGGAAGLIFIAWRNEQATHLPLKDANDAAARAYASQDASAASADTIRALGMREAIVNRHLRERETMMRLQTEASFKSSTHVAASKFVRLALQSGALGLGALLAINDQISPGAIFAAMFLVGRALAPIDQMLGAWRNIVQMRDAHRSLSKLLLLHDSKSEQTTLPPPQGRIEVENVSVFGKSEERPILSGVRFAVEPGEVVGIVGPSGAGKSTLARVIAGALTPDRGTVRFGGAEQTDWDPEILAQHVGYMPQEPTLFAGTIKDNIARFRSNTASGGRSVDAAAIEAAKLTGAHDVILRLSGGYDYELDWGGRGLSTGQAQRIAFARAVFGSPDFLVLDEPNSHLDADGDLQLITTLGELKANGVTILIVTHKLSILPIVDKLVVMQDGRVEMYGPRDDVMGRIAPPEPKRPVTHVQAGTEGDIR